MSAMRVYGLLLPALLATVGAAWADDLTAEQRKQLQKKSDELFAEVDRLYQRGEYPKAVEVMREMLAIDRRLSSKAEPALRESLEMHRRLFPREKFPDGHRQLATCLDAVGRVLQMRGEYARAEPFFRDSLEMSRRLYPPEKFPGGHHGLASALNNL